MPPAIAQVSDQKQNEYIISFKEAEEVEKFILTLEEYIRSQAECPDTVIKNEVNIVYASTSGGGGIISGCFDSRVLAFIKQHTENTAVVEPNIVLQLAD